MHHGRPCSLGAGSGFHTFLERESSQTAGCVPSGGVYCMQALAIVPGDGSLSRAPVLRCVLSLIVIRGSA